MAWKQWPIQLVSIAFIAFAFFRGFMSILIGPLVDRYSALKLLPIILIPLGISIAILVRTDQPFWAFFYLAGAGMTVGFSRNINSAAYAELYGTKQLGSIRGFLSAIVVLSTGIAPLVMGYLIDEGVNPNFMLYGMIIAIVLGVMLSCVVALKPEVRSQKIEDR
jgi:MFS family permease